LTEILKDRECNSSEEIEQAIAEAYNDVTVDEVQSVFQNWTSRLVWVIENGGEYVHE
jgi:hypothetical protein